MTERDVLRLLRDRVKAHDGNEAGAAKSLGVSRQYFAMVLGGRRRPIHPGMLKALGLRHVERFEPV